MGVTSEAKRRHGSWLTLVYIKYAGELAAGDESADCEFDPHIVQDNSSDLYGLYELPYPEHQHQNKHGYRQSQSAVQS